MPAPLRVLISSTDQDLHAHRAAANEAIQRMGQSPLDMRYFNAQATGDATSVSLEFADQADLVILIIAWRYGMVLPNHALSITQEEYHEAVRLKKPMLAFLADPATFDVTGSFGDLFPLSSRDPDQATQLLAFRHEVETSGRVVDYFTTPDDLGMKIVASLHRFLTDQQAPAQEAAQHPYSLLPRAPSFVGRERELQQVEADLRRGQHVAIVGLGGIGKTALAAEVAAKFAGDNTTFAGGRAWIRGNDLTGWAGVNTILSQLMLDWEAKLNTEELAAAQSPQHEAQLRLRALQPRLTGPTLILLDNVEQDLPVSDLLALLASARMTVLLTTRIFFSTPLLTLCRLDVLASNEAQALLRDRFVAKGGRWEEARDTEPASHTVAALGYLPLAIELAAARAARLGLSMATLDREMHAPEALAKLADPTDPHASVSYGLGRTLALLSATERQCFAALGMLPIIDYPQVALHALFAGLAGNDKAAATQIFDTMLTLSLLQPGEALGIPRAEVHPLLLDLAAREWQALDQTTQVAAITAMLAGLTEFARTNAQDFTVLAQDEMLVMAALRYGADAVTDRDAITELAWLFDDYLYLQGRWTLRREALTLVLKVAQTHNDRANEGRAYLKLGVLDTNEGKYAEASVHLGRALLIVQDLNDQVSESRILNYFGNIASDQGRFDEAHEYFEQALAIHRTIKDRLGEARTLNNLGLLVTYQKSYEQASIYLEQGLTIAREIGDRVAESAALLNLGDLVALQEQYDVATGYYKQALTIAHDSGDRYGEGIALASLGSVAEKQGRYDEGTTYIEQAIVILHDIGDPVQEGLALNGLGTLAEAQKRFDAAIQHYEQALALLEPIGYHEAPMVRENLARARQLAQQVGASATAEVAQEVAATDRPRRRWLFWRRE